MNDGVRCFFVKSVHLFVNVHTIKDISNGFHTDLSRTPLFSDALCFDVIVPGVFVVSTVVIVIDGQLRLIIHDAWGRRPASAVHTDRRIMDFRRRS